MSVNDPVTDLNRTYSSAGTGPTPWKAGRTRLAAAEIYWLSTVRPDGRPHVTPLVAVWREGTLYFSTGPEERKAQNLAEDPRCVITTGCNTLAEGLDVVVEGDALRVHDRATLRRVAQLYTQKYDVPFRFEVREGRFYGAAGEALVFAVTPAKAFGFGRGETFSQTRWRFDRNSSPV